MARSRDVMAADELSPAVSLGLLVLRIVSGLAFAMHGYQKLFDNGLDGTQNFFDGVGVPLPAITAVIVTFLELIGGLALIAGALTRLFGVLLVVDMVSAMFIVHIENGFFVSANGYELVMLLGGAALALVLTGAGAFSLDQAVGVPRRRSGVIGSRIRERRA